VSYSGDKPKRGETRVDANAPIPAEIIRETPSVLANIDQDYIIIYETCPTYPLLFKDMIGAINMASTLGWQTVSMVPLGETGLYALLRREAKLKIIHAED
jgi:hypothetical protein